MEYRFAAVLSIAQQERGVGASIQQAFSPEHIAEVAATAAGIAFGSAFLQSLGPVGQIVSKGIEGYMTANGGDTMTSFASLIAFMRHVGQVSSLREARAWALVTSALVGDLSNVLDAVISRAATRTAHVALENIVRARPGTPRELARAAGEIARDPAARQAMLSAVEGELARMGREGQVGTPEYRALEAMQVEIAGARPGRPVDPAVETARDAALPGRQQDTEEMRALEFARPRTEAERAALRDEVPAELRGRVRVVEYPLLQGSTVQVVTMRGEVQIRVGRGATATDVRLHLETARDLSRYTGPLGRIRQLQERIQTWIDAHPRYGTRGDEARREVEKLDRMITELRERQSAIDQRTRDLELRQGSYDPTERAALDVEIESLERQLFLHARDLGSLEAGRGFVAATDARATVLAALLRTGLASADADDFVRQARQSGQLEAVADLVNVGTFGRLVAAGLAPSSIVARLRLENGYRDLTRAVINPSGPEALALGRPVADELARQRTEAATASQSVSTAGLGAEWGIRPDGEFHPSALPGGLTVAQIEDLAFRRSPPPDTAPRIVYRRWRYVQRVGARQARRVPFEKWAEAGYQANLNREVSSPFESRAIAARGAFSNNDPAEVGGQMIYAYEEFAGEGGRTVGSALGRPRRPPGTERRSETTRPDGIRPRPGGGFDVVEHKHLTGTPPQVLDDSIQLRAQREMAREMGQGIHEVIISSDQPMIGSPPMPQARPSQPLGAASRIYYFDDVAGRVTHVWNSSTGTWRTFTGASP
jgi:hypothetical protein